MAFECNSLSFRRIPIWGQCPLFEEPLFVLRRHHLDSSSTHPGWAGTDTDCPASQVNSSRCLLRPGQFSSRPDQPSQPRVWSHLANTGSLTVLQHWWHLSTTILNSTGSNRLRNIIKPSFLSRRLIAKNAQVPVEIIHRNHRLNLGLPPNLHLASSEQWCWSWRKGNIRRTVSVL